MKVDYMLQYRWGEGDMIRYLMKQNGANVTGKMPYRDAMNILKQGEVYVTDEFEGYPLTADGVYYFDAMYRVYEDEQ